MKDVLQAFESSFLALAEAQHYLEANEDPMEKFPGYIISIFNTIKCSYTPAVILSILFHDECPLRTISFPGLPPRILERINKAKADARGPCLG